MLLHKIVVYRHFSFFQCGFQNSRQRSRDYLFYYSWQSESKKDAYFWLFGIFEYIC